MMSRSWTRRPPPNGASPSAEARPYFPLPLAPAPTLTPSAGDSSRSGRYTCRGAVLAWRSTLGSAPVRLCRRSRVWNPAARPRPPCARSSIVERGVSPDVGPRPTAHSPHGCRLARQARPPARQLRRAGGYWRGRLSHHLQSSGMGRLFLKENYSTCCQTRLWTICPTAA